MYIPRRIVEEKLKVFLTEDLGQGDITAAIIPPHLSIKAQVIAKEDGLVAGLEEAVILAEYMGLKVEVKAVDGQRIRTKQVLMELFGDAKIILTTERTLLNLISRMSGIATQTRQLVDILNKSKTKARIAATRKTAPGLNWFDTKAVAIAGADTHRLHLDDMVLIKDNHLAIIGDIQEAVKKAKKRVSFSKKIEVEVANDADALLAAKSGADIIMLDNFSPQQANETITKLRKAGFEKVLIEISGGITQQNLLTYAKLDVDIISIGSLTNSVKALDINLEIKK
jgi:nicotinate-nucleotide pyrophosphorylase (carboxylating)